MASSGKRKTTMAKLNRESRLRDKRAVKAARKDARNRAAEDGPVTWPSNFLPGEEPVRDAKAS
jgi:hypothetical protein